MSSENTPGTQDGSSAVKNLINRSLGMAGYKLSRVNPQGSQTKLVSAQIPGWFSDEEAEALYIAASLVSGNRFLEIGHFLGRSTSAICEAIRDSGFPTEFNSYDLGFANAEEFVAHYKRIHDTTSVEVPAEYDQLVFAQKTTTTELAKRHLARFGLDRFVNLINGDFTLLDRTQYDFVFCDALHDPGEIRLNLPFVVTASSDDCVWAFHDMTETNVAAVLQMSSARLIRVIDTLGIFRFRRTQTPIAVRS